MMTSVLGLIQWLQGAVSSKPASGRYRLQRWIGIAFGFVLAVGSVGVGVSEAGVVTQTRSFQDIKTVSGSGTFTHIGGEGLDFSVNPFNASLGTLNSFTISWSFNVLISGVAGASLPNVGTSFSGGLWVEDQNYWGYGNGTSLGGNPNASFGPASAGGTATANFYPSGAGSSYAPQILSYITGSNPFDLRYYAYGSDVSSGFYGTNVVSYRSELDIDMTLTYNYTAAPVPEPTSMAIFGLGTLGVVYRTRRKRQA